MPGLCSGWNRLLLRLMQGSFVLYCGDAGLFCVGSVMGDVGLKMKFDRALGQKTCQHLVSTQKWLHVPKNRAKDEV